MIDALAKGLGLKSDTKRPIDQYTSFARVAYWHYEKQLIPLSTNQSQSIEDTSSVKLGVIETEIESIKVDKDINAAAGTFEITLLPSKNWKAEIAPGDWLVIQMFTGKEEYVPQGVMNRNVVLFGNVDRISRSKQRDENSDKTLVRYIVSGRDFGKVFEDTDIFFDPRCISTMSPQTIQTWLTANGIPFAGNPGELVEKVFSVFLGGTPIATAMATDTTGSIQAFNPGSLRQWVIPLPILAFFFPSVGVGYFKDVCQLDIMPDLPGFGARMTIDSGEPLWQVLQRMSNQITNELFCDLRRDPISGMARPTLILRSRPASPMFKLMTGMDVASSALLKNKWFTMRELAADEKTVINLSDTEVRYENLGRNHQTMFNMLWLQSQNMGATVAAWASTDAKVGFGIGNPVFCNELIRRYGLKRLDEMIEFVYLQDGKEISHETQMLKGFLMQRYDQVAYNHLYETGTIETVGKLDASLGMALRIYPPQEVQDDKFTLNKYPKLYYVEGYTHEWKYPGMWTTTWKVTNGVYDGPAPFIDTETNTLLGMTDWGALVAGTVEVRGGTTPVKPIQGV